MQNYRTFAQASAQQRSPLATSARRGPGPMVPPAHPHSTAPPAPTPQQVQAQRLDDIRRQDAARRISKKPTDRDIPHELHQVVVGDGVQRYARLREVERQLDAVMMRKRLDVSDNVQRRYTRREGVMRVWVSNTAEGQPWQVMEEGGEEGAGLEFGGDSRATFRVKIEGRLLDDPDGEDGGEMKGGEAEDEKDATKRPRFSHFFKAITIDFSRPSQLQPDGYSAIEWVKPQPSPANPSYDASSSEVSFDTLELERKADENINVIIKLVRDEKNERFRLSPQLAAILDTTEEDRAGAVQGIWEYCRAMNLQEDEDRRSIVCDEPLRKLFGQEKLYFPYVPDLLLPHLHPLPPLTLQYTIRVDKAYIRGSPSETPPSVPTVYDLAIPLPNPLAAQLTKFHTSKSHLSTLQTIVKTDDDLALLVQKVHNTNAKRKFYDSLAKDPGTFVKRWVASQRRDLEVVLAEGTRGGGEDGAGEEFRRGGESGLWGGVGAREAVGGMLAKAPKAH